jgi:hypothetical protein
MDGRLDEGFPRRNDGSAGALMERCRPGRIFRKLLKFRTDVSIIDSELSNIMKTAAINSAVGRKNSPSLRRVNHPTSNPAWTSFERRPSYEIQLASAPEVRAEMVARGRALIADPNYPSREQLVKIGRLLLAADAAR